MSLSSNLIGLMAINKTTCTIGHGKLRTSSLVLRSWRGRMESFVDPRSHFYFCHSTQHTLFFFTNPPPLLRMSPQQFYASFQFCAPQDSISPPSGHNIGVWGLNPKTCSILFIGDTHCYTSALAKFIFISIHTLSCYLQLVIIFWWKCHVTCNIIR